VLKDKVDRGSEECFMCIAVTKDNIIMDDKDVSLIHDWKLETSPVVRLERLNERLVFSISISRTICSTPCWSMKTSLVVLLVGTIIGLNTIDLIS